MDLDDAQAWANQWRKAAPELAAIRAGELRRVDVARFIDSMQDVYAVTRRSLPARSTSGLVIQQRLFATIPR